jgi:hypothetical protein
VPPLPVVPAVPALPLLPALPVDPALPPLPPLLQPAPADAATSRPAPNSPAIAAYRRTLVSPVVVIAGPLR